jgi:hypothetical protein
MLALNCSKYFTRFKQNVLVILSRNLKTVVKLEENLSKIRNIGVIAHIDAG